MTRTKHAFSSLMAAAIIAALAFTGCGGGGGGGTAAPSAIKPTFVVKDTSDTAVAGATVYAIPAADVEALAAVPISSATNTSGNFSAEALTADEPLEDLISANSGSYASAVTDATGKAVFAADLAASDKFFIAVKPGTADHLPGGSICRESRPGSSLNNTTTQIEVSTTPSAAAAFVGSSTCLLCHTSYSTEKKTMHKLGIMAMSGPSGLQDPSEFTAGDYNLDKARTEKFTAGDASTGGTTIYFYDYDSTRKFDKFKTLESAPSGTVYATVRIYRDSTDQKYKAQFNNVINPSDPNSGMIHEVKMSYGGGVYKQRFMTTIGDSIYMIPLQFNQRGDEASTDRVRKQWRDYHMDWWVGSIVSNVSMTFKDIAGGAAPSKTFDAECAACHYTGFAYDEAKKQATGVSDTNGETHPVLGTKQELNIGCESCHGPGSEHVNAGGAGKFIVSPSNITPERASMICGQCHSRPQGNGTFGKNDAPVDASNRMMRAGTSRADFLASNTSRHDARLDSANKFADYWTDAENHSKSHHQQYTDFIRSGKYRNGTKLLTCASCHDPHGPGADRHQLSGTNDNALCLSCHATVDIAAHQTAKTGSTMGSGVKCIDCHTTKTANSGAGLSQTSSDGAKQGASSLLLHGDISSHLFDVPTKAAAPMPVPYTNPCGVCHNTSAL